MIQMIPMILTLAVCGVVVLVLGSLYCMCSHAAHNPDFLK